jgi:hypothetical protein
LICENSEFDGATIDNQALADYLKKNNARNVPASAYS